MSALLRLLTTIAKTSLGVILALALLEGLLRMNPGLMLKGMPLQAPVDPPLTRSTFKVYASDGDAFYWNRDLVKPVPASQDSVVATVNYTVDEFGFPNAAPLPASVDVVVLGRSYSMGAQATMPWPRLLSVLTSLKVLNLSQPGSGIDIKTDFYWNFAAPRHPHWIIIEVLPSEDIIGFHPAETLLIKRLEFPVVQALVRQVYAPAAPATSAPPIYPLDATLTSGQKRPLTFFPPDLNAAFATADLVERSGDWADFTTRLLALTDSVRNNGVCVALLYVPTKPEVYIPLVANKEVLTPALANLPAWGLDKGGFLTAAPDIYLGLADLTNATEATRPLMSRFAAANHLTLIDPTDSLRESALSGADPFLPYDTHWSAVGHEIVARQVADALKTSSCG